MKDARRLGFKECFFFMFWSRDLPHMVWLMKRDRGGIFKPLFNEFSNLCYYFTSFNLSNVGEFFWSWILKDCCFASMYNMRASESCERDTRPLFPRLRADNEARENALGLTLGLGWTRMTRWLDSHDSLARWLAVCQDPLGKGLSCEMSQ